MMHLTMEEAEYLLEEHELSEGYCDLSQVFDDIQVLDPLTSSSSTQAIVRIRDSETNKVLRKYMAQRKKQGLSSQIFVKFMPLLGQITHNMPSIETAIYKYLHETLILPVSHLTLYSSKSWVRLY